MKSNYVFDSKNEKLQDYLTRMAKVLDAIQEEAKSSVVSAEEANRLQEEEREIKDYIATVLEKDVEQKAKRAAFKNKLSQEQGVVYSYLMMDILDHLHKYNNPRYTNVQEPRSFDAFAGPYIKAAVDSTLGEKKGVSKHLRKKINHIDKTIQIICLEQSKEAESVSVEEIFDNQHKTGDKMFLTADQIQEALIMFMDDPYHFDSKEEFEVEYHDDYRDIENEEALNCVKAFLGGLTDTKRYLFIGRALLGSDKPSYKEISITPRFLEICRDDDLYSRHILRGDLEIERPKSNSEKKGILRDVEYVDPDFLETQFRSMKKQFKRLENPSKDMELLDLLAALNNVMVDIWEVLNR